MFAGLLGGMRGLGAAPSCLSALAPSPYQVAFGSILSWRALLARGSSRSRLPRVSLLPHVSFHALRRDGEGEGGVTLEQGRSSLGSKMFTRSSACVFRGRREQDLVPAFLVLSRKATLFPSAILTGGPGSPGAPGSPASPGSPWVTEKQRDRCCRVLGGTGSSAQPQHPDRDPRHPPKRGLTFSPTAPGCPTPPSIPWGP